MDLHMHISPNPQLLLALSWNSALRVAEMGVFCLHLHHGRFYGEYEFSIPLITTFPCAEMGRQLEVYGWECKSKDASNRFNGPVEWLAEGKRRVRYMEDWKIWSGGAERKCRCSGLCDDYDDLCYSWIFLRLLPPLSDMCDGICVVSWSECIHYVLLITDYGLRL